MKELCFGWLIFFCFSCQIRTRPPRLGRSGRNFQSFLRYLWLDQVHKWTWGGRLQCSWLDFRFRTAIGWSCFSIPEIGEKIVINYLIMDHKLKSSVSRRWPLKEVENKQVQYKKGVSRYRNGQVGVLGGKGVLKRGGSTGWVKVICTAFSRSKCLEN